MGVFNFYQVYIMHFYKIIVAYDGTDFHGWQIQPADVTVTSTLQKTWFQIFKYPITLVGASRTDAGVHALGQVARFQADIPARLNLEDLRHAWNVRLPKSIHIRSIEKINNTFHPCTNVRQKIYHYTLFLKQPLPFVARFGWHYRFIDDVDMHKFEQGLGLYLGTHDFASFCKQESDDISTIRTIDAITVKKFSRWGALMVTIKGKSFVRFQIRRMIGYALDVARRPLLHVDYLQDLLRNPNPQQTLLKADGSGLCLRKVIYHDDKHST